MPKRILPVLVGALVVAGLLFASQWRKEPMKVSGFIEAHEIRLGSRVGGRVAKVLVEEGDAVKAGQVLVELEPFDLLDREAEALANLAAYQSDYAKLSSGFRLEEIDQAKARVNQLEAEQQLLEKGPRRAEIEAARAHMEVAKASVTLAQRIHDRNEKLRIGNTISAEEMDQAVEALNVAKGILLARTKELQVLEEGSRQEDIDAAAAKLAEAKAALALLKKGYRDEEVAQAKAKVDVAKAALAAILAQKTELKIVAPMDGVIESLELQPGDLTTAGGPVMSMMETGEMWVRAYLPERLHLKLGQIVPVTVDVFPDELTGEVTFISRQAEFTPSNVQTPEERSKQVFRIKVTLRDGLDRVRPGMSADVWLKPRDDRT
ncbi:MAG: efflux RND transporter periplasmic adaptor subunit [Pirellulales bacterium]|nr:efflux RND transporter periplasmic adaptor subunit [Pirellulales bacterium]